MKTIHFYEAALVGKNTYQFRGFSRLSVLLPACLYVSARLQ